jgi:hypothetical protein
MVCARTGESSDKCTTSLSIRMVGVLGGGDVIDG